MKTTAWKIALYGLLLMQLAAIGLFVAEIFFGKASTFFPYQGLALLSFFGLMLWCVESVHTRPDLTRFALRGILIASILWCATPLLLPFRQNDRSAKRRADVTRAFHELIAERKIPNPPDPVDAFTVGSRHGGGPYSIRYKDFSGQEQRYFVSDGFERFWLFRNMQDRSELKKPSGYQ